MKKIYRVDTDSLIQNRLNFLFFLTRSREILFRRVNVSLVNINGHLEHITTISFGQ